MTTRTHSSIVTKTSTLAGLSAATLAMTAAVAAAQVPDQGPPGGGFGPGGGGVQVKVDGPAIGTGSGPVSLIMLVTQPSVQKELQLTDAQKQKISKIEAQLKEKAEQARNLMAPKPGQGGGQLFLNPEMARAGMEEMKQGMQALHSEADAAVIRELHRKQRTRLEQIKLQADGPLAFERPDVLERLNLQAPQIELIQAILADGHGQMEQSGGLMMRTAGAMPGPVFGPGPGAGGGGGAGASAGPGGAPPAPQDLRKKVSSKEFQDQLKAQFEKRRKETQSVRDRMMQAIGQVLTRGQRTNYRTMLGEPFDLKPLQNAAPNISVTTFDGPGAGAGDGSNAAKPRSDQPDPTPTASQNKVARSKRSR
jgi:hypothetical protein